jgi:HD-like signal output (HDOD) protein
LTGGVAIPPCPAVLIELGAEMKRQDPRYDTIAGLISRDVGLSATLLKTVNSPFFGLRQKVSTPKHAVSLLGLKHLSRVIAGLLVRRVFADKNQANMELFWDNSARVAQATSFVAKQVGVTQWEEAYTFGLFQDCGIALLMMRFADYSARLGKEEYLEQKITEVENKELGTDHATLGYFLTKSWGLPPLISEAVHNHHDYSLFADPKKSHERDSVALVAVSVIAHQAVHAFTNGAASSTPDWAQWGPPALEVLEVSLAEADQLLNDAEHQLENKAG